jgi:hypothetical protein
MSTVINFFTLPELADELEPGEVVRVESAIQETPTKTPGLAHRTASVHVRAVDNGSILTFKLHVGTVQTLHGEPRDEEAAGKLESRIETALGAVRWFLATRDLMVLPGLIDIGGAEPVRGTWDGLEVDPAGEGVAGGE